MMNFKKWFSQSKLPKSLEDDSLFTWNAALEACKSMDDACWYEKGWADALDKAVSAVKKHDGVIVNREAAVYIEAIKELKE